MEFDPVLLARIQFGFTIAFHILFPAFTIGLASFIVALEALWLYTGKTIYRTHVTFWTRIFALGFGMGVVTGVVLSYQVGANFGRFSRATGNILGPLLAYEVLTAFFLEAGFVGIMLFGIDRVGKRLHFFASCMVAVGTLISAFWILAANSWMQTPAGHRLVDGVFYIESWWDALFNPSFPYRYAHMVTACYLTAAFIVIGISAWYLLWRKHQEFAKVSFSLGLWAAAILAPTQIFLGDLHGLNTREHQPMKLAAIEGRWETERRVPLTLFAIPNEAEERNDYAIEIPLIGSLILTHELDGEIKGLKEVAPSERPPVWFTFFGFRIMVGCGMALFAVAMLGLLLRAFGRLYDSRWFHFACAASTPLGFIAILAGWVTTETGRQPWTVYGLMRTADSVSAIQGGAVATSLALFFVVYNLLLLAFFYFMWRTVEIGPVAGALHPGDDRPKLAMGAAVE